MSSVTCQKSFSIQLRCPIECTLPVYTGLAVPQILEWSSWSQCGFYFQHDWDHCAGWQCPDGAFTQLALPLFGPAGPPIWDGYFRFHNVPPPGLCAWYPHTAPYPTSFCVNGYEADAALFWDEPTFPGEVYFIISHYRDDANYNYVGHRSCLGAFTNIPHAFVWGPPSLTVKMRIPPP